MRMPPNRVAVVVLLLLVIACIGAWWWQAGGQPDVTRNATAPILADVPKTPSQVAGKAPSGAPGMLRDPAIQRCERALRATVDAHARVLGQRPDALSQAIYALAMPSDPALGPEEEWDTQRAMRRVELRMEAQRKAMLHAASLAPEDSRIQQLAVAMCGDTPECDERRRAQLERSRSNLDGWLDEISIASARNDPHALAEALKGAAAATDYQPLLRTSSEMLLDAFSGLPDPPDCTRDAARRAFSKEFGEGREFGIGEYTAMMAFSNNSAFLRSYGSLLNVCRPLPDADFPAQRQAQCRAIAIRLADGPYTIDRGIGLAMMVSLAGVGTEARHWRERYREYQWMMAQASDPSAQALMQAQELALDEARVMQAALEASGLWPPPADWLPADERARSLILTGRPPPGPPK